MSEALVGLLGALVGGLAAVGGAALQARSAEQRAREEAKRREREAFHALVRRYLFQLQDAVESLRSRVENWARFRGREYSDSLDPGYWEPTSLYAFARALGAERVLSLEGVYVELEQAHRELEPFQVQRPIEKAMGSGVFFYHLLALAESVLERGPDGFQLLTYTEFRQRYDNNQAGIQEYLKPAAEALSDLTSAQAERMEQSLGSVIQQLERVTREW